MTPEQIQDAVSKAIQSDHWMVRTDDEGKSHNGFHWKGIGQWTTPANFSEAATCKSGGLFGQSRQHSGFNSCRCRVVFCETGRHRIGIDGDKVKTEKARILLVNDLSLAQGMKFEGNLSLAGCTGLTALPEGLSVGGWLNLNGCTGLTALPEHLK